MSFVFFVGGSEVATVVSLFVVVVRAVEASAGSGEADLLREGDEGGSAKVVRASTTSAMASVGQRVGARRSRVARRFRGIS